MTETPVLGVIGGSGLYRFDGLADPQAVELDTPYGKPSSPIVIGTLAGRRVAFLARHGIGHIYLPTEVNYRANIYALKMLGVTRVLSVSACGSLRADFVPGHMIIPDQLIDFTRKRSNTFFGDGLVAHISVADPFCADLSDLAYQALNSTGITVHKGASLITIEGPRFSTRAELHMFRAWGISLIGMTACPEAFLAREAEMCYSTIAHVTDFDVWHISEEPVTVEMVINTLKHSVSAVQEAIKSLVENLPIERDCECGSALAKAVITDPALISASMRLRLNLLIGKYFPS